MLSRMAATSNYSTRKVHHHLNLDSQEKLKTLYKLSNVHGSNKIFDKELKSTYLPDKAYVLDFNSPTAKICFPREDKKELYLIQQFLNLQLYLYPSMSWIIEMVVSDHTKVHSLLERLKEE